MIMNLEKKSPDKMNLVLQPRLKKYLNWVYIFNVSDREAEAERTL